MCMYESPRTVKAKSPDALPVVIKIGGTSRAEVTAGPVIGLSEIVSMWGEERGRGDLYREPRGSIPWIRIIISSLLPGSCEI